MNIVILNGSPKGKHSITLQYVRFLEKQYPMHDYQVLDVARHIKKLERDEEQFMAVIEAVRQADLVIWAFGLWVLAVSAQYMRFIELITERGVAEVFHNKYTAAISTSINYFDHTAHNYMRAVCEDLGMQYVDGISLDIMDLRDVNKRAELLSFADSLLLAVENSAATSRRYYPLTFGSFQYQPSTAVKKINTSGHKVLIITDCDQEGTNLKRMINRCKDAFDGSVEVADLNKVDIRGGCLGCMKCGYNYQCQYRDGFRDFYNQRVRGADLIIIAGNMKGRYLSSLWKTFFDRAFFWNHTPSLERKQIAYVISGPISRNENLAQILEASVTARQNANFVDIISDEVETSALLDAQLDGLAGRMMQMAERDHVKPQNFLAVGGHKIFRDNIWGRLRGIWQADHRYYRKNGYYDFPQYNLRYRLMGNLLIAMTTFPRFRKKFYDNAKKMPSIRFGKLIAKLNLPVAKEKA